MIKLMDFLSFQPTTAVRKAGILGGFFNDCRA